MTEKKVGVTGLKEKGRLDKTPSVRVSKPSWDYRLLFGVFYQQIQELVDMEWYHWTFTELYLRGCTEAV